MRIIRSLVVLLSLASIAVGADSTGSEATLLDDQIKPLMEQMSVKQKIGQLFIFGFNGQKFSQLKPILDSYMPGGVILFSRNIKTAGQVLNLNTHAQNYAWTRSKIPLFLAVDQEGGSVSRIKSFPPQPSALAIGGTSSADLSEKIGFYSGKILRALGFNLNLAPVLDIADPRTPSFLGTRSFSGDPNAVGLLSEAFSIGLHNSGVLATLKHFPGHGNETVDPHFKIPNILEDLDSLEEKRLKPFRHLLKASHAKVVMVAHLGTPNIDPDAQAATYSKVLITDVLRNKLGFKGIIMTDDIDMASTHELKDPAEKTIRSLIAGADMVMIAWNRRTQKKAVAAVEKAIHQNRLSLESLDEKVERILRIKLSSSIFDQKPATFQEVRQALRDPNLRRVYDEVTRLNLNAQDLPRAQMSKVVVLSRSKHFLKSFMAKALPSCCIARSLAEISDINRILESERESMAVVHVSGRSSANLVNRIASRLRQRVIVVNTNTPSLVRSPETFARTVNLFTYHPHLGRFLAEKIIPPNKLATHLKKEQ